LIIIVVLDRGGTLEIITTSVLKFAAHRKYNYSPA